jgi:hypothetical protein
MNAWVYKGTKRFARFLQTRPGLTAIGEVIHTQCESLFHAHHNNSTRPHTKAMLQIADSYKRGNNNNNNVRRQPWDTIS